MLRIDFFHPSIAPTCNYPIAVMYRTPFSYYSNGPAFDAKILADIKTKTLSVTPCYPSAVPLHYGYFLGNRLRAEPAFTAEIQNM